MYGAKLSPSAESLAKRLHASKERLIRERQDEEARQRSWYRLRLWSPWMRWRHSEPGDKNQSPSGNGQLSAFDRVQEASQSAHSITQVFRIGRSIVDNIYLTINLDETMAKTEVGELKRLNDVICDCADHRLAYRHPARLRWLRDMGDELEVMFQMAWENFERHHVITLANLETGGSGDGM